MLVDRNRFMGEILKNVQATGSIGLSTVFELLHCVCINFDVL